MVKILKKCILSILVYNLFLDRQRNILYYRNISIQRYIGCLHEIEMQIFKKYSYLIGQKIRLDINCCKTIDLLLAIENSQSKLRT